MNKKKAIVVGAGIAGIAVALRLKKQGYDVVVFESNDTYGGKIKDYKWLDYRFDTGPSLFTLPHLVDELFILFNKDPRAYFTYTQLPVVTKYFYQGGLEINAYAKPEAFAKEVEFKLGIPSKTVLTFLRQQEKTYKTIAHIFLENPIHLLGRLLKWKNVPALFHLMQWRFTQTMNNVNSKWFGHTALVKLFNRFGTYNGSNPYVMPSLFNIIAHLEHNEGAFLPENGMSSIPHALYKLAIEEGVVFNFESYVNHIKTDSNGAKGVMVKGKEYLANVIVLNMDVNYAYHKLLPNEKAPVKYLDNELSSSALIFHWAVDAKFEQLDVHNILFAENYEEEFEYLFKKKKLYSDPTIYIYISSKSVKGDAPIDGENWFVMINVPHVSANYREEELVEKGRKMIIAKIKQCLNIDINPHIIHEHTTTPSSLQNSTHSYLGSLYGASSNSMLSAFFRHPNFCNIKKLYFAGGTVHPGGGIPLCLLSAKITSDLIAEQDD